MPIYEYRCRRCGREFEALIRNGDRAECPRCQGASLERKLSTFAAHGAESGGGAISAVATNGGAGRSSGGCCGGACGCH